MPDDTKPGFAIALDIHDLNKRVQAIESDVKIIKDGQLTEDKVRLLLVEAKASSNEKADEKETRIWSAISGLQKLVWIGVGGFSLLSILATLWVTYHAK